MRCGFFVFKYNIMKILKFGGSSVGSPANIQKMQQILLQEQSSGSVQVIVSAFGGVTDQLITIAQQASKKNESWKDEFDALQNRQLQAVKILIPDGEFQDQVRLEVQKVMASLMEMIMGVNMLSELSKQTLDHVMSFGERLSALIVARYLAHSQQIEIGFLDAREVVVTDSKFGGAYVDFDQTYANIQQYFEKHDFLHIITGFIGNDTSGNTTTLGRGGSDYTAAIFGAALDVSEVQIWTDVDGLHTADPRIVPDAFPLPELSYKEAMELSHFGAKVIYPPTMKPVVEKNIPLRIKNTYNPSHPGTKISESPSSTNRILSGITSIKDIAMLRVEGLAMVGVPGISSRIFGALAEHNISVILISQSSSEHSICFAVLPEQATEAKQAIEKAFGFELKAGDIDPVIVETDLSIIAAIGENMRHNTGISGRLFQALGDYGVNIVAISQGSGELNISCVVPVKDREKAVSVIHQQFFQEEQKHVYLYLVGTGLIGQELLNQIQQQKEQLESEYHVHIHMAGVCNSKKMMIGNSGFSVNSKTCTTLLNDAEDADLKSFMNQVIAATVPHKILVDATSSEMVVEYYQQLLSSQVSVVTPNKKANTRDYVFFQMLQRVASKHHAKFCYETTVGAGLPIVEMVTQMKQTGDEILRIEGVFSGTLSYLFNTYDGSVPFSQLVQSAKELGYTEPDPRDDLSGMDVARKLLILSRIAGVAVNIDDVDLQNLVPEGARDAKNVDSFFTKLAKYDDVFLKQYQAAKQAGKKLRYMALLENNKLSVSLQALSADHPCYNLSGSDNKASITSKRYCNTPLVIQGPGAGAEVTAAGVFADILKCAL